MSDSVSFAMTFIFSFFMAGLTGFYVGSYFLSWDFNSSLFLAVAFIMGTIILETTLFILKDNKKQAKKGSNHKKYRDLYDKNDETSKGSLQGER